MFPNTPEPVETISPQSPNARLRRYSPPVLRGRCLRPRFRTSPLNAGHHGKLANHASASRPLAPTATGRRDAQTRGSSGRVRWWRAPMREARCDPERRALPAGQAVGSVQCAWSRFAGDRDVPASYCTCTDGSASLEPPVSFTLSTADRLHCPLYALDKIRSRRRTRRYFGGLI